MIASSSQFSGGDQAADSWMEAPVSSRSRFGDDLWYLDILPIRFAANYVAG